MLEIQNVSVKYNRDYVLKRVSIEIETNSVLGVLGKNGAGKTTLFNTIYGSVEREGSILWKGEKVSKKSIGYLETENYFYPYITGREYLNYFNINKLDKQIESYTSIFDLPLDELIDNYSTGMKKKIALIALMIMNRPINILDEPFNGLDFEGVTILYDIIKKIKNKNKIVIVSSHIIETLFHTCDRIVLLENGVVNKIFTKEEFGDLSRIINE